jgi:hypothetical protein
MVSTDASSKTSALSEKGGRRVRTIISEDSIKNIDAVVIIRRWYGEGFLFERSLLTASSAAFTWLSFLFSTLLFLQLFV